MTQTTNPKYSKLSQWIVDAGNWCQRRILNVAWQHKLSLIELMVATVFSLTAYYYTEKFSPLDLPAIPSYSTLATYTPKERALFSTTPLPLEFITHELSGKMKNVYAVTVTFGETTPKISIQSLMDGNRQFKQTTIFNLGGEEFAEIAQQLEFSIKNPTGVPSIFIVPGVPPRVNTVSIVIEDYTGHKDLFTYVIYSEYSGVAPISDGIAWRNIHFVPIKYLDIWHPTNVSDLYAVISWEDDPFWKDTDIKDVEDFKNYLTRINVLIREPFFMFDSLFE
ncbi:hypothetical protein NHG32_08370 [Aerococcaceae bacterium NML191219]|nr:hypothetical protein [Aerococcaceae bacterium NML191219]